MNASSTITIGDLTVHRLGFGAMRLVGKGVWGPPADREASHRVLRTAMELGVDFIDTSDAYGPHINEEIIAEALHPYPKHVVIATKGGLTRSGPDNWTSNGRPQHLRLACEGSLVRLRTQRIQLYQLHAVDARVPIEDSIGELTRLQAEGKIQHIGVSNVSVDELARARKVAKIVSVQNRYNISDRASEAVLAVCEKDGLAFLPWFPIGAGKALEHDKQALAHVAARHKATPRQVAIAWLLAHSKVNVPIPGTSSIEHLKENVGASNIQLTPDDVRELS